MILAIDTATPVCSVALEIQNRIFEKRSTGNGEHSEKLFLYIDELFKSHNITISDLDAILINEGPGSYTGLRIGAAAVKGLLFRHDVPLYSIGSLHSIAAGAVFSKSSVKSIHAVIDARRIHLYYQKFSVVDSLPVPSGKPEIKSLSEIEKMIKPGDAVAGTGIERLSLPDLSRIHVFYEDVISAKNLLQVYSSNKSNKFFNKEDSVMFEPFYLTMNQVINNTKNTPE